MHHTHSDWNWPTCNGPRHRLHPQLYERERIIIMTALIIVVNDCTQENERLNIVTRIYAIVHELKLVFRQYSQYEVPHIDLDSLPLC